MHQSAGLIVKYKNKLLAFWRFRMMGIHQYVEHTEVSFANQSFVHQLYFVWFVKWFAYHNLNIYWCLQSNLKLVTWSGPLSNILRVRGNWWEWGVYWTPIAAPALAGRLEGSSLLAGDFVISLVRLELLALGVGGDPLKETLFVTSYHLS